MQEVDPLIKYVLYQDSSSKWRIQAVPVSSSSFQSRLALPEQWRGLRDGVLSEKAGVEGCIFIHASGFIGGANTYEGATFSRAHTPSLVPHSSLSVLTHSFTFPPSPLGLLHLQLCWSWRTRRWRWRPRRMGRNRRNRKPMPKVPRRRGRVEVSASMGKLMNVVRFSVDECLLFEAKGANACGGGRKGAGRDMVVFSASSSFFCNQPQ